VRIVLDTSACIYLLEGGGRQAMVRKLIADRTELVVSAITLAELLVKPIRNFDIASVALVEAFVDECEVVDAGKQIARQAAKLRATNPKIKMPDALIISTAIQVSADRVIGNDRAWADICPNFVIVDRCPLIEPPGTRSGA
jgi:predicted nucleic acid-binding protein